MPESLSPLDNPYVGPRPFGDSEAELFFGRPREIVELDYLLSAERVVLFYAPSGAGKSSLINAGLIPRVRGEFDVWSPTRLNEQPPRFEIRNRYAWSAAAGFEREVPSDRQRPGELLAEMSLRDYVKGRPRRRRAPTNILLIFDQVEEILRLDRQNLEEKRQFFMQLGDLLEDKSIWALLALREDYLAQLDPYCPLVPTHLRYRYRIDRLDTSAAIDAITGPTANSRRKFADGVAEQLVKNLAKATVQRPDGSFVVESGTYVEPMQLQVVCRGLWEKMPTDDLSIDAEDVERFGDVNRALTTYYDDEVRNLANSAEDVERQIRDWFGRLFSADGVRQQLLKRREASEGLSNSLIDRLIDTHLVRAEERANATWYELAHDRLVDPVRASNEAWKTANLAPWQRKAALWSEEGQPESLLLESRELSTAKGWAGKHKDRLSKSERKYIGDSTARRRTRIQKMTAVAAIALLSLYMGVYYLYSEIRPGLPWAYFVDAETGAVFPLSGPQATLGRSVYYRNTVTLAPIEVSRMHALVAPAANAEMQGTNGEGQPYVQSQDHVLFDNRSTNGTTVNATFVPYGDEGKVLENGDIVELAGVSALRYYTLSYPLYQFWKKDIAKGDKARGWALFVDGLHKKIIDLTEDEYFLRKNGQNVILTSESGPGVLVEMRRSSDNQCTVEIRDTSDESDLVVQFKGDDYKYPSYLFPSNEWKSSLREKWKDRYEEEWVSTWCIAGGTFYVDYQGERFSFQFVQLNGENAAQ